MFDASALPKPIQDAKVFPCQPRGKLPATKHGFEEATNNPEKIAEWWRVNPEFNCATACGLSGLVVFDVDPTGLGWYEKTINRQDQIGAAFRNAFKVKTPRGGYHIYFSGSARSTVSAVADGVDTRGEGGYVLLPGSRVIDVAKGIDGGYTALGGDLVAASAEVLALIPDKTVGAISGDIGHVAEDLDRNLQWGRDLIATYIQSGRVAVEGSGGNNTTYQVAASLLDKGLSIETALELMSEEWNAACAPPWPINELHQIIVNAAKYGEETKTGAKGFQEASETFKAYIGVGDPEEPTKPKGRRFQALRLWEARKRSKSPEWLIPGFIPAVGVGLLYGRRSAFKTFVALDMALSLASDIPGQWGTAPQSQTVVYMAGEGASSLIRVRSRVWEERYALLSEPDMLVFPAGVPRYSDGEAWQEVKDALEDAQAKPVLIVIDTVARLIAGMDENSAKDATAAMGFLEDLAKHYSCFILGIHHAGKDEGRGARGSSVFEDAADTVIQARKVGTTGTELFIKKQRDSDYDPDFGVYLGLEEIESEGEKSIILVRKEKPVEAAPVSVMASKTAWIERGFIVELLSRLGGEATTHILAEEIVAEFNVEIRDAKMKLKKAAGVEDLRTGDMWKLKGFDL